MNGNFPNQPAGTPFSAYPSGPALPTQYPHHNPNDSNNALMTTQAYSPKQEVLQKIANSPGALQRLMLLLQQQQEPPMPPPLDLNTPASEVPNSAGTNPVGPNPVPQRPQQEPMNASTMMTNNFDQMHLQQQQPNAQTMSFLQPEPMPPATFDTYIENANNLQRVDTSAAGISDNIDEMQSNIDSLIQKLGMDPQDFVGGIPFDNHMDGQQDFMDHTDGLPDMLSAGTNAGDFDFSAFMNDYAQGNNTSNMYNADPNVAAFNNRTDTANAVHDVTNGGHSPRLSAYVDEIASQSGRSDTSSAPSVARGNIAEDGSVDPIDRLQESTGRKHRKRRSDVENASMERTPPASKKRR